MKWILFFVFSGIVVFVTTLYFNLGGHKDVILSEVNTDGFHVIYKLHDGPYHKIINTIESVEAWAAKNNIPCPQTFGEYRDDPRSAEESRLRSHGGCILSSPVSTVEQGLIQRFILPGHYLKASFEGAPSIGPFKVYPKAEDWARSHRIQFTGPVIEVYTVKGPHSMVTEYYFPMPK